MKWNDYQSEAKRVWNIIFMLNEARRENFWKKCIILARTPSTHLPEFDSENCWHLNVSWIMCNNKSSTFTNVKGLNDTCCQSSFSLTHKVDNVVSKLSLVQRPERGAVKAQRSLRYMSVCEIIFIAGVQSTREGNVFTFFVRPQGGGVPCSLVPSLWSQVLSWGTPVFGHRSLPGEGRGYPCPCPSQDQYPFPPARARIGVPPPLARTRTRVPPPLSSDPKYFSRYSEVV